MQHDNGGRAKDRPVQCKGCGCAVPQQVGRPGRKRIWCDGCNPHRRRTVDRPLACKQCGGGFPPRDRLGKPRLFCSTRCRRIDAEKKRKSRPMLCEFCGVGYLGRKTSRFCGPQCRRLSRPKPTVELTCKGCGEVFRVGRSQKRRLFCTFECKASTWKVNALHHCLWCGKEFRPANRTSGKFCSRECAFSALKAGHPQARESQKVKGFSRSAKQRCILYGVPYEVVRRQDVFERDGWTCGICGVELLRHQQRDPETNRLNDRCPTIDHIIPLSLGPPSPGHIPSNVMAACRKCNVAKGASVDEATLHSFAGH